MPKMYFVGVDVGTSSARAALVASDGTVLKQSAVPIKIWHPEKDYFEQSSENIWEAVCKCVESVTEGVCKEQVIAISFDATCSLVILGDQGQPLSVSKGGNCEQNVILWMDHRAQVEAEQINATQHELLRYVGGQVSLEMEMPKMMWLKKNMYSPTWTKLWRAFDLADFLTWRSTGMDCRSLCTVVCKWNYDGINMRWDNDFLAQLDLSELCHNDYAIIGRQVIQPGEAIGKGLSQQAAKELGLRPGTVVGTALIDALAGALSLFGCQPEEETATDNDPQGKLAVICGTSTCHMSLTRELRPARGIWGPYNGAIFPDYFLSEGGQSATGLLLDQMIKAHPQYMYIKLKLKENENVFTYLNNLVMKMADDRGLPDACYLTKDVHVWPDFHGNRSPIADVNLRGMITGLGMNDNEEALAILYLAFVQSLAYGTRHIIENLHHHKHPAFHTLIFCGGLAKNSLYVKSHSDVCQLPIIIPNGQEMVLVGSAMLAACAAKVYGNLQEASIAMGGRGTLLRPKEETKSFHNRKYRVFLKMLEHQRNYTTIMNDE